jgi:hypothetical protein
MRFSRILGLVWTLGVLATLVIILKLRIGYVPALEPGLVWVIEAIFTLFVLWSVGVLLFSVTTGIIGVLTKHSGPAVFLAHQTRVNGSGEVGEHCGHVTAKENAFKPAPPSDPMTNA